MIRKAPTSKGIAKRDMKETNKPGNERRAGAIDIKMLAVDSDVK